MAATLNAFMRMATKEGIGRYFWLFASLCAAPVAVLAQELADPTRPPAEISVAPNAQATAAKNSGLQSIIISNTRRAAIINGQTVEVGAMHGEAKLVGVDENGVVLEGPQGRQVLELFPGVEIKRKELPKEDAEQTKQDKQVKRKKKLVKNPASQAGKKEGK